VVVGLAVVTARPFCLKMAATFIHTPSSRRASLT
jgi:hypothetical protein